jgi:hypothetical protein
MLTGYTKFKSRLPDLSKGKLSSIPGILLILGVN